MGKYIIAVGGTGVRCLESFLHVSAIGGFGDVKETYHALIIEGDKANGNKNRLQSQIANYITCQKVFYPYGVDKKDNEKKKEAKQRKKQNDRGLFKDVFSVDTSDGKNAFKVWEPDFEKGSLEKMSEELDDGMRGVMNVLYSPEEMQTDLSVGFRGHPNIGSLTIDYLMDLEDSDSVWYRFLGLGNSELREGNKTIDVMIVGSVFGGTGAAGLYAVANKLRKFKYMDENKEIKIDCPALISEDKLNIGICMMLPYYSIGQPVDEVDGLGATNIMENTVHALDYYSKQKDFLEDITIITIGKSNQEVLKEDKTRGINQYAVGDAKQKNKSMTPELIAAYAFDNFFKGGNKKGKLIYGLRQKDITNLDDEDSYVVNWSALPISDQFQDRLNKMLTFSLCYTTKIYPVIQNNSKEVWRYHWLGKCVNDLNPSLRAQASSINDYCNAFIDWALDIGSAGDESSDHYELIDYENIMELRKVEHDTDVDYEHLVIGAQTVNRWKRIWEQINGNATVKPRDEKSEDDQRMGLHLLIADIFDAIK